MRFGMSARWKKRSRDMPALAHLLSVNSEHAAHNALSSRIISVYLDHKSVLSTETFERFSINFENMASVLRMMHMYTILYSAYLV